ncbi:hypothetical protein KJ688_12625 [bacterium]|nr:hypothetical protein [bacterium]
MPKNIFTLPKFGNFFSRIAKAAHEINTIEAVPNLSIRMTPGFIRV